MKITEVLCGSRPQHGYEDVKITEVLGGNMQHGYDDVMDQEDILKRTHSWKSRRRRDKLAGLVTRYDPEIFALCDVQRLQRYLLLYIYIRSSF